LAWVLAPIRLGDLLAAGAVPIILLMRRGSLLTQVLVANLLIMIAAVVATLLATKANVNLSSKPQTAFVLGLAVALSIAVNVVMLQRRFRPLERLVDEMERADLTRPGGNLLAPVNGGADSEEVRRLHDAFRVMLERLEAERRRTSSAALRAQEQERARVARDLHDEVNQALTGVLLRLEAVSTKAPIELSHELAETKALANQAMQELLTLARALRPTALDDHGLVAALGGLVDEIERRGQIHAVFQSEGDFGVLPADVQLVVYRVAQEAMSNAVRHADAANVTVELRRERDPAGDIIRLIVGDDGHGFTFDQASAGLGLPGMRERALLVGGDVQVESRPDLGTRVRLSVPLEAPG
jgi:two-component system sensor histidine kinase UhpB